jgi:hypothetical protein
VRLWVLVIPRSASRKATDFEVMAEPAVGVVRQTKGTKQSDLPVIQSTTLSW